MISSFDNHQKSSDPIPPLLMGSMHLDDSILSGREHHVITKAFKPSNNYRFRKHMRLNTTTTL
jgi:hypothetical protein